MLTHHASETAFVRDGLCFLGCWCAVALVVRLYTRDGWWRLALTWLVGISAAAFVRAAIVGRWPGVFYAVALGLTALLIAIGRTLRRLQPA